MSTELAGSDEKTVSSTGKQTSLEHMQMTGYKYMMHCQAIICSWWAKNGATTFDCLYLYKQAYLTLR